MLNPPENIATAHKYNAVANHFAFYDLLFFYPQGFRAKGVDALGDVRGKRVLEIGCGTGLNFRFLVEKVGPGGTIIGIDLSKAMVEIAQTRCGRNLWSSVSVHTADADRYRTGELFDAAYFGLSFTILHEPRKVLDNILNLLRPGGRIVILETRIPKWMPRFIERWLTEYAHRNFGTQPDTKPWEIFEDYERRGLLKKVELKTVREYSYYVLSAEKA
jgi:demethylmenaquinone methyltransferase/2-methoxy-6-polyprenyl-1,4-benzoquinol methylase